MTDAATRPRAGAGSAPPTRSTFTLPFSTRPRSAPIAPRRGPAGGSRVRRQVLPFAISSDRHLTGPHSPSPQLHSNGHRVYPRSRRHRLPLFLATSRSSPGCWPTCSSPPPAWRLRYPRRRARPCRSSGSPGPTGRSSTAPWPCSARNAGPDATPLDETSSPLASGVRASRRPDPGHPVHLRRGFGSKPPTQVR